MSLDKKSSVLLVTFLLPFSFIFASEEAPSTPPRKRRRLNQLVPGAPSRVRLPYVGTAQEMVNQIEVYLDTHKYGPVNRLLSKLSLSQEFSPVIKGKRGKSLLFMLSEHRRFQGNFDFLWGMLPGDDDTKKREVDFQDQDGNTLLHNVAKNGSTSAILSVSQIEQDLLRADTFKKIDGSEDTKLAVEYIGSNYNKSLKKAILSEVHSQAVQRVDWLKGFVDGLPDSHGVLENGNIVGPIRLGPGEMPFAISKLIASMITGDLGAGHRA